MNNNLGNYFTAQAQELIGDLSGKKILLVGVAYKPNISDVRETPALNLISALRAKGAKVSWHDEKVANWKGEVSTPISNDFDLIILVNPHDDVDVTSLHQQAANGEFALLDTRGNSI